MNVMLVSVIERTRKIGLRIAVGAEQHHIRKKFLVEALTLGLLGGLIGVALGVAAMVASLAGWPIFLSSASMLLAFAAVAGVFFGYYPARRAAEMDPIRCLKSDSNW